MNYNRIEKGTLKTTQITAAQLRGILSAHEADVDAAIRKIDAGTLLDTPFAFFQRRPELQPYPVICSKCGAGMGTKLSGGPGHSVCPACQGSYQTAVA